MSELRVPTVAFEAEIICADGRTLMGRIFLPAASSHHPGPMRPEEWMNATSPFFPFLPAEASTAVILNRAEVVVLTVSEDAAPDEEAPIGSPIRRVQVECRQRTVSGTVVIDMPEEHRRVLDYLNRAEAFLTVHEGDRRHLVRKARITRVVEPKGD